MDEWERLSHNKWKCKYRVAFIPWCRRGRMGKSHDTGAVRQQSWQRKLLARTRLRRLDVFSR